MLAHQQASPVYPISLYDNAVHKTIAFQSTPLDIHWFDTRPTIGSIIVGSIMLLSSAAIIGLGY
jgi:hypothetical protein